LEPRNFSSSFLLIPIISKKNKELNRCFYKNWKIMILAPGFIFIWYEGQLFMIGKLG